MLNSTCRKSGHSSALSNVNLTCQFLECIYKYRFKLIFFPAMNATWCIHNNILLIFYLIKFLMKTQRLFGMNDIYLWRVLCAAWCMGYFIIDSLQLNLVTNVSLIMALSSSGLTRNRTLEGGISPSDLEKYSTPSRHRYFTPQPSRRKFSFRDGQSPKPVASPQHTQYTKLVGLRDIPISRGGGGSLAHKLATHPRPRTSKMNPKWLAPCYICTPNGVTLARHNPKWRI